MDAELRLLALREVPLAGLRVFRVALVSLTLTNPSLEDAKAKAGALIGAEQALE